jgi:putative oxidoreductase
MRPPHLVGPPRTSGLLFRLLQIASIGQPLVSLGFDSLTGSRSKEVVFLLFPNLVYLFFLPMLYRLLQTDSSPTTLLIRLAVGLVFFTEGLQKFILPAERGAGRFAKIGLPAPEFLGSFVGGFETVCGLLVLLGLCTRLASVPLLLIMLVAIVTTKTQVLLHDGFWELLHGSRTDWAMLLGSVFLLLEGGGRWSVDRQLQQPARR